MASEDAESSVILHCYTNEQRYIEAMEQTASFNTRLSMERKMRLPFLDSQTGVAQRHTGLFHPYRHRQPGKMSGQLYSYPEKRWKKKKRSFFSSDPRVGRHGDIETGEADMHQISAVENPAHRIDENDYEHVEGAEGWYDDLDDMGEPPDDGAMADDQSDISDYEDTLKSKSKRRKTNEVMSRMINWQRKGLRCVKSAETVIALMKKSLSTNDAKFNQLKTPAKGGRRKKTEEHNKDLTPEERDKPYACEACGARYKTRPGLAYHYSHFHNGLMEEEGGSPSPKPPSRANSEYTPKSTKRSRASEASSSNTKATKAPPPAVVAAAAVAATTSSSASSATAAAASTPVDSSKISANNYCDFCLGDAAENKKTKSAEELVSCSDCGRSGHPTCLQFTDNMIISVKKYPWQCIECKSCGLCGTSDNDDQLLFCDDCDRGYHMYCLNPPLSEPPEGSWSCHLCIEEFHDGKKPAGMN